MLLEIGVEVIDEELLLQFFIRIRLDPQVEIHPESKNFPRLPIFPEPSRDIEEDCLQAGNQR